MPTRRSGGVGTTRRKHSIGNLRRAHPASGATWNVQVVRGKMSSKCLWHACRALILGLTLMLLGAGMATLGYYADHLSMGSEIRGNVTVRVKNDLKGFHLNNFSYVGPIVMGFGGFIVVASCVMTFEARDSAAKVVPARLRAGGSSKMAMRSNQSSSASQRRAIGMQLQSSRWDQHFGVFRSSPAEPAVLQQQPFDRDALTAELVQFSKSLSITNSSVVRHVKPPRGTRISNSLIQRNTRETAGATCSLLQPPSGRLYWQASSFDEGTRLSDKHAARCIERNKRSDTARRHVLARQKPIEHDEDKYSPAGNRRNSTFSDSSYSGRWTARCTSNPSRTSSIDSRRIQVDLHSPEVMPKSILRSPKRYCSAVSATPSVEKEFRSQLSVCSEPPPPIRQLSGQSSLEPCFPEESIEYADDKYQAHITTDVVYFPDALAITMETTTATTNSSPTDNYAGAIVTTTTQVHEHQQTMTTRVNTTDIPLLKKQRPDSLPITNTTATTKSPTPKKLQPVVNVATNNNKKDEEQLILRSNSSRSFYRRKPKRPKELDDSIVYMRSANRCNKSEENVELYDSLRVINERRTTLLRAESETTLSVREHKRSTLSLMENIPEKGGENSQNTSIEIEDVHEMKSQSQQELKRVP